ncbi:MAG: flippase-like domain-containing protein [Chloroflexi bacterium]|nr:flippase-like domain-containing protein [Chloroflexota bacterium]
MLDRRFWLGLGASAFFILLLLWRIDLRDTAQALIAANYYLVLPAIGLYFLALFFRTIRWGVMLRPLKEIGFGRLFPVMSVGYMANNLLPVRLGELVRSYYLGEREGVSKSATLATIAIERVLDGVVLLLFLVVLSVALPVSGLVRDLAEDTGVPWALMVGIATLPFVVALGLLVLGAFRPKAVLGWLQVAFSPLPQGIRGKLSDLAALFFSGLAVLRDPRRFAALALLTVAVWLGEMAMYFAVGLAFGLTDYLGGAGSMLAAMLAVTATSNLATSLPSSQGGIGPFELFAAGTLVVLGAPREAATAYAVALHVALLVPVTLLGLAYLWSGKGSLVQMVRLGATRRRGATSEDVPLAGGEAP